MLAGVSAGTTNAGHITAVTDADDALAIGSLTKSFIGDALLQNSGVIIAGASGNIANAVGVDIRGAYGNAQNGYVAATVGNQGRISAMASGDSATATGAQVTSSSGDGVRVDNAGTITAAAYGADSTAMAVAMNSQGSNVLNNSGTIGTFGDGTRIAISSGAGATASIANQGTIIGAIRTGNLDDVFGNAASGVWHAVGDSDFGAGDDHIVNHGVIVMDDAVIGLGSSVQGNTFDNDGKLVVSGRTNVLDMGGPVAAYNNGLINFVAGAPDDVLTILGNFSGQGAIDFDVSGLNQTSDQLVVDGNVIQPTTQTINVNLVDLPTTATVDVPLVEVSGDSADGNFVLGNVGYNAGGFVSMAFNLKSTIDASNASADVVSLVASVTGLGNAGSLAADIGPGAQSLVGGQIGTWRQRMGVQPARSNSMPAPWLRMFSDSGDVHPHQQSSNFGTGDDFGFHQSNSGWELGLDAQPAEHLAVGLLIGKSKGDQRLDGGNGTDHLEGQSFGLYGTWRSDNGFYVDASQRWTSIDARLKTAAGTLDTHATADAFNVEAGFAAWTTRGINVVPQLQYTRTRVSDIPPLRAGNATFVDSGGLSSRGRLGVAFDTSIQAAGLTLTPYGSLNVVREFAGDYRYAVNGGLLGATNTTGSSAMVELGLSARRSGFVVTGGVNWTDGGALKNVVGGQLVVRYGR